MHSTVERARTLLEALQTEHPHDVLQELGDLIKKKLPRSVGRPAGKGDEEDSDRIDRLVELLQESLEEDDAVRQVAREDPGHNEVNTRRRLYRKLPEARARLENLDPEKEEILKRLFADPIEPWDL